MLEIASVLAVMFAWHRGASPVASGNTKGRWQAYVSGVVLDLIVARKDALRDRCDHRIHHTIASEALDPESKLAADPR